MSDLIDKLKIDFSKEVESKHTVLTNMQICVSATIEDPLNPGQKMSETTIMNVTPTTPLRTIIMNFKKQYRKFKDVEFYVLYNNRLLTNGTVGEAGITNKKNVSLVSLVNEQKAAENEGFKLTFWSLPFLMVAISFLIAGLAGTFNIKLRGAYVLISSIFGVPSFICLVIGSTEKYSQFTQTAFSGSEWFGDCQSECCCGCCGSKSVK